MTPSPSGAAKSADAPLLDLDALVIPIGRVKRFGQTHDVLPIDGVSYALFVQLTERGARGEAVSQTQELELATKILAQVMPTMSPEHLQALALDEKLKIIVLAGKSIDKVKAFIRSQDLAGNARRPVFKGRAPARSK